MDPAPSSFLERLGLHRPELRAWALYDWANSVFMTTILQVFPIYFSSVVMTDAPKASATAAISWATVVSSIIMTLASPVLGALADLGGLKKTFLAFFMSLGVISTAGLGWVGPGQTTAALVLFILANAGAVGSIVFYDSLLPHVARERELDRVTTAGFALGYAGGGILLALNLWWIQAPETFGLRDAAQATRLSFLSAAIWWLLFSIPIFRRVHEPKASGATARPEIGAAFRRLGETLGEVRRYRDAFLMLLAFVVYYDGINTIIRLATAYGTEIGISSGDLIKVILMVQFLGIPFSFLFGAIASRIGAKAGIFICLAVYTVICVLGYFMTNATHFFVLGVLVAMVQGGSQALSRSLFALLIPKDRSAEFFGFFGVFDKVAGIFGPAVFAATVGATGSSRNAMVALVAFFVIGAAILSRVDVARGRTAAEGAAVPSPA